MKPYFPQKIIETRTKNGEKDEFPREKWKEMCTFYRNIFKKKTFPNRNFVKMLSQVVKQ